MVGRSARRVCPSVRRGDPSSSWRRGGPRLPARRPGKGERLWPSLRLPGRSGQVGPPPFAERGPGGSRGAESASCRVVCGGASRRARASGVVVGSGRRAARESHEERQSARRRRGVRGGVPPPPPPRLWAALLSLEAVVLRPPPARPARARACLPPPLLSPGRPFSSSLIFPLGGASGPRPPRGVGPRGREGVFGGVASSRRPSRT